MSEEEDNSDLLTIEEYYLEVAQKAKSAEEFLDRVLPNGAEVGEIVQGLALHTAYAGVIRSALETALPVLIERGLLPPDADMEIIEEKLIKPMERSLPEILVFRLLAATRMAIMESFFHAAGTRFTAKDQQAMEKIMAESGRHPNLAPVETRGRAGVTTTDVVKVLERLGDSAPDAEQKDVARMLGATSKAVQRWQDRLGIDSWKTARRKILERIPKAN